MTRVFAGIPAVNRTLMHRLRFSVGDPVALVEREGSSALIVRDIEMERARLHSRAQEIHSPADFPPPEGLSGDRETATAQSLAEYLFRQGLDRVQADRSFPLIFTRELEQRGIAVDYHPELGTAERRAKDEWEIGCLEKAQKAASRAVERACRLVARCDASGRGVLTHQGEELSSERLQAMVDIWLLEEGFENPPSILAGGASAADCHFRGSGPLRTGEPILIDIFPRDRQTGYNGDCTRTVVHGKIPGEVEAMHRAVAQAHEDAVAAVRAGTSGEAVHKAAIAALSRCGYKAIRPPLQAEGPAMTHGTGHGIGLEVHEPPLLDFKGPPLVEGDALTIEPALYSPTLGGVRIEDMVIVTADGCRVLCPDLPRGLDWR